MPCPSCQREHKRSKNGPCARCYRKKYRQTPQGRIIVARVDKKYHAKNPNKVRQWVYNYRKRTTYYLPQEVLLLYAAVKRLEKALAATENGTKFCEPSKFRCDKSIERDNRYGKGKNLRSVKSCRRTDGKRRSNKSKVS